MDGEAKRDTRPEGSSLFHALLQGEFMKAHTLAQYAGQKMNVTHHQIVKQLGGTQFAYMNSFEFAELHAGQ